MERDIRKKKSSMTAVTVVLFLISASLSASATTVSISDVFMESNETAVTSIMINNVSDLGVADITLSFEPSVVRVISATNSDFDVFYPVINNTGGFVRAGGMDDGDGLYGDVKFADITFEAVGDHGETSALNLSINELKKSGMPETSIPAAVDNGTAFINFPPVGIPVSVHRYNNVGSEYPCEVIFNASGSYDPDGDEIITYHWDFGDGHSDANTTTEHVYSTYNWNGAGYEPFNVCLTVEDDKGLANTTIMQVNVFMAGDASGDGLVDIEDGSIVSVEFWEVCSGDSWDTDQKDRADLNNDCIVDIEDASIVSVTFWDTAW